MSRSRILRGGLWSAACLAALWTSAPQVLAQPGVRPGYGARGAGGPNAGGAADDPMAQAGPPIKTGRILEATTKNKLTTLKIEDTEGETYEVKLNQQFDFAVVAPGDKGMIRKGVYVTARGVNSENKVFLTKVTVHVVPKGKRLPPGRVQAAEAERGESLKTYEVAGEVVAVGPAEDYPDYTVLALKVGGRTPPVWLEPNHQVEISSALPQHAVAGADLQMAMRVLPSKKMLPMAIRIARETPFTEEELFGE